MIKCKRILSKIYYKTYLISLTEIPKWWMVEVLGIKVIDFEVERSKLKINNSIGYQQEIYSNSNVGYYTYLLTKCISDNRSFQSI